MTHTPTPPRGRRDLVRVLVELEPYHLDRPFDYLRGDLPDAVDVGWRVEVVFAGRVRRAVVVGRPTSTDVVESRLRPVRRALGDYRWMTDADLDLVAWAADRWCGPRADVVRHALPGRAVRVEESFVAAGLLPWDPDVTRPVRDPVAIPQGWARYVHGGPDWWASLPDGADARVWRPLPGEDVAERLAEAARATLAGGRDVLVVVPDANSRVAAAVVAHLRDDPGLDRDELVDVTGLSSGSAVTRAWLRARTGTARVVVGERRVALWPLARPGLYVVLDEANPALKERRSPRHHAREVALERARRDGAVALLVTHVPSAPTWSLLRAGRLGGITADRAAEVAAAPRVVVDDHTGVRLGRSGVGVVRDAVRAGTFAVVLAARRGEGRALVCAACGHRPVCSECGSSLAGADGRGRSRRGLWCPTCGWATPTRRCRDCGSTEFVPLAAGTERLASELRRAVQVPVHVLEGYDAEVGPPPAVLVMTRGSVMDAPPGPVGGVVAGDVDSLLRRPSVDAPEDTLRLLMALGAWLGGPRSDLAPGRPGGPGRDGPPLVVVTREPDHPAVVALRRWDAGGFWRADAEARAPFPPSRSAIAVTAPDDAVAAEVTAAVAAADTIVLGPAPVDDGRRLLLLAKDRPATVARLATVRRRLSGDNVTLVVDVDPVDLT